MKNKIQVTLILLCAVLFMTDYAQAQVVLGDGIYSTGSNEYGQLGNGEEGEEAGDSTWIPVNENAMSVSGGYDHGYYLRSDNSLWAFGSNRNGQQLGIGEGFGNFSTPAQVVDGTDVIFVGSGRLHGMFIKSDSTLWTMGHNGNGQLGDGTTDKKNAPVQVADNVIAAAAGERHTIFLKADSTLWGMGRNSNGELGLEGTEDRTSPVQITTGVIKIGAGYSHSLFIDSGNSLWAMGDNNFGQLGDGSTENRFAPVEIDSDVVFATGGSNHSLYIKDDATLWGMGRNQFTELGLAIEDTTVATPVQIPSGTDVISASAGARHSHFIQSDGSLWAIGDNGNGQLGNGTTDRATVPEIVATGATGVLSGGDQSYVIGSIAEPEIDDFALVAPSSDAILHIDGSSTDELTFEWEEDSGELFVNYYLYVDTLGGDYSDPLVLDTLGTEISSSVNFKDIDESISDWGASAAGDSITVQWSIRAQIGDVEKFANESFEITFVRGNLDLEIVDLNYGIYSSGYNEFGQLGTGEKAEERELRWIPIESEAVAVTGGYDHGYFMKNDRTMWAFGSNRNGQQLGIDMGFGDQPNPTQVVDGENVASIASGRYHGLFIKTDSTLWAMGNNKSGQLGDGSLDKKQAPVQITDEVIAAAGGEWHSLFIKADGSLYGMGDNSEGQLGIEGTDDQTTPKLIEATDLVKWVDAGYGHSLYITNENVLWGMGSNGNGQLGDGTTDNHTEPVEIATNVTWVGGGANHTLFIKDDNTLWGMGRNSNGELGLGHRNDQLVPIQIPNGTDVMSASAGIRNSFFVKSDSTLWATGDNGSGQLGMGSTTRQTSPIHIANGASAVFGGGDHSYVLGKTMEIEEPVIVVWEASLDGPGDAEIEVDSSITVSSTLLALGVTDQSAEELDNVSAWIGYNTENVDPTSEGWTWISTEFNGQVGEGHNYSVELGSDLEVGTYYFASAFVMDEEDFIYGGYNSENGGGLWDGTDNVSGVLNVKDVTSASVEALPREFSLSQNYPNPFNPTTNITFALPEASDVIMDVYSLTGQKVATLVKGHRNAGYHTVSFDGKQLASGIYIYRIQAGDFVQTKKLTLIK
ncbi:MAG: T9SS type A sorting domain-containing protein [Balneolales bacterium]